MSKIQGGSRIALLSLLTVIFADGCSRTESGAAPSSISGAETYKISSQADFDALKPLVFNGGDQILLERGRSFQGALSIKRSEIRPEIRSTPMRQLTPWSSTTRPSATMVRLRALIMADSTRITAAGIQNFVTTTHMTIISPLPSCAST